MNKKLQIHFSILLDILLHFFIHFWSSIVLIYINEEFDILTKEDFLFLSFSVIIVSCITKKGAS